MISLLAFDSTISGITSELSLLYNLAQLSLAFTLYITTEHEEDARCAKGVLVRNFNIWSLQ